MRQIVERIHARYLNACERGERPAVPALTMWESLALARCGFFPIPAEAVRYGTPEMQLRRFGCELLETIAEPLGELIGDIIDAKLARSR